MVRQVFPTIYDAPGASPLDQQTFRPRPVADAQNRLLQLKIAPTGATMFPDPYPAAEQAGPTMARANLADTPLPPSRPAGLGQVLASAVQPAPAAARIPPTATALAPAAQPQSSMFTGIDRANSGPNDRFRGGGTALNLSGLLGGLFGGGGSAPAATAPAAAPAARAPAPTTGVGSPDMTGITFDENGNPTYNGLDASVVSAPGVQQQTPPQLASAVGKAGWWKSLR